MKTVDMMMSEGLICWRALKMASPTSGDALLERAQRLLPASEGFSAKDWQRSIVNAHWCHEGFPLIDIESGKTAAALALTDPPDGVRFPWSTFVVRIQPGVIAIRSMSEPERGPCDLTTIKVRAYTERECLIDAFPSDGYHAAVCQVLRTADLCSADGSNDDLLFDATLGDGEERSRVARVIRRIVANACLFMEGGGGAQAHGGQRAQVGPATEPKARRFVVGKTVEADFREAVHGYVRRDVSHLRKVQWTVRGHWTMQACGAGRRDRRRTWIAPHWARRSGAGDDAPILLRAHSVDARDREVNA